MKKDANEYLANKKTFADKTGLSVAKNPKKLTKIQEYRKYIYEIWGYYSKIYNLVEKEVSPMVEMAYEYYYNKLLPNHSKSSIDSVVTKLKSSIKNKNDMENLLKSGGTEKFPSTYIDLAKQIYNRPDLFSFVLCYINQPCKERFSKWIETEYFYLLNFKDLVEDEMLKYHNHGAYIDTVPKLKKESKNLIATSEEFYSFCKSLKKTTDLKNKGKVVAGYLAVTVALNLPIPFITAGPAVLKPGLKLLNDKKKSLIKNISDLINETNDKLDKLIDQKPGKNDLNVKKVTYMHKISKELG